MTSLETPASSGPPESQEELSVRQQDLSLVTEELTMTLPPEPQPYSRLTRIKIDTHPEETSLRDLVGTVDPSPLGYNLLIIYSETCLACNFLKKTFGDPDFKNIIDRLFGQIKWVESGDIFTKENFLMFQETSSHDCTKLWNFSNISVPIIYMYKSTEEIKAENLILIDARQFIGLFAVNPSENTLKKFLSGIIKETEKNVRSK